MQNLSNPYEEELIPNPTVSSTAYDDHEHHEDHDEQDAAPIKRYTSQTSDGGESVMTEFHGAGKKQVSQEDMINITSCDFKEFARYMGGTYGERAFERGYKII